MNRLTKDGKILYKNKTWEVKFGDGANPESKKIWINISSAIRKLSVIEDLLEKYEVNYPEELEEILTVKQGLLKLDFLEDAMDLPTNCFSTLKNRNGDEVTIMRRKRYEEYQEQSEVLNIIQKYAKNDGWSDGWVIEFWNMKPRELDKVCKYFKN